MKKSLSFLIISLVLFIFVLLSVYFYFVNKKQKDYLNSLNTKMEVGKSLEVRKTEMISILEKEEVKTEEELKEVARKRVEMQSILDAEQKQLEAQKSKSKSTTTKIIN